MDEPREMQGQRGKSQRQSEGDRGKGEVGARIEELKRKRQGGRGEGKGEQYRQERDNGLGKRDRWI